MTHLVMIEIAKLRKPVRERVIDLCNRNLCLKCESKPQHACGRCPGCLNEVYQAAKYLSPLDQAKRVAKMITAGTLLGAWDKTYKPRRAKVVKAKTTDQSQGMAG
jgi:hypothetical protein